MESSLQRSLEIPTGLSAAVAEQSEQGLHAWVCFVFNYAQP